jgi:hypothetical protein
MAHPSDDELQIWADGEASDAAQAAAWRAHVDQCGACAAKVNAVRSLGRGVILWAESVAAGGGADDLADRVMRAALADKRAGGAPSAKPERANVVPMRGARRRWVWGAAPIAMAAAAAVVFAVVRPGRPVRTNLPHPIVTLPDHRTTEIAPTPEPDVAPGVDPGSEVLSVVPADHTTYSVLEVQAKESGTMTAVVWIDDGSGEGTGAVQ